eukprot:scaffold54965_cov21-Tisochrysis_lutea.AAC.1
MDKKGEGHPGGFESVSLEFHSDFDAKRRGETLVKAGLFDYAPLWARRRTLAGYDSLLVFLSLSLASDGGALAAPWAPGQAQAEGVPSES